MTEPNAVNAELRLLQEERLAAWRQGQLAAATPGDTYASRFHYVDLCWRVFIASLACGQICWRYQIRDRLPFFLVAIDAARRAASAWSGFVDDERRFESNFGFGTACIVVTLVEGQADPALMALLSPCRSWETFPEHHLVFVPDDALALALSTDIRPEGTDDLLDRYFLARRGKGLLVSSMKTYFSLLEAYRQQAPERFALIEQAENLYLARASDLDFENFGVVDGGNGANWLALDYRLAAILRRWAGSDTLAVPADKRPRHRW